MCGCEHVVQVHSKRCELWTISNFKFDPGAFLSCVMGSSRKRYEFGVRIWKKVISASEILGEIHYSLLRRLQKKLYIKFLMLVLSKFANILQSWLHSSKLRFFHLCIWKRPWHVLLRLQIAHAEVTFSPTYL
jgi:hypothetical protein